MNWERYLEPVYQGPPFVLFGPAHLTALAIVGLLLLSLFRVRNRWDLRARSGFRLVLACWLVFWELAVQVWFAWAGTWSIRTMLPLHLCGISLCPFWVQDLRSRTRLP